MTKKNNPFLASDDLIDSQYYDIQQLQPWSKNNSQIKKLKETGVIKSKIAFED
jgi:hypothetical protein